MARIAYIRVSTEEQDTMRQEDLMAGQNIDRYYIEKISGKNADRPQLKPWWTMCGRAMWLWWSAIPGLAEAQPTF